MKKQNLTKQLFVLFAFAVTANTLKGQVSADIDSQFTWYANGPIRTSVLSGDTLFFGGEFTELGKPCKNAALLRSNGLLHNNHPENISFTGPFTAYGNGFFITKSINDPSESLNSYSINFLDTNGNFSSPFNKLAFNGPITKMVTHNDKLYVGGSFTSTGTYLGYGHAYDTLGERHVIFPDVNGEVHYVLADGNGGWYLAGSFTQINGVTRNGAARINADGTLHAWNPDLRVGAAPGTGHCLARHGNTVYIGGFFSFMGTELSFLMGGVDSETGAKTETFPFPSGGYVKTLMIDNGKMYAGGSFTGIFGGNRQRIACYDLATKTLTPLSININNGEVKSILVYNNILYAAGSFTLVNSTVRQGLLAYNLASNTLVTSIPQIQGVGNMLAEKNGVLFLGGEFVTPNAPVIKNLGFFIPNVAAFTNTDFQVNSAVKTIAVLKNTLYFGGSFTQVQGQVRKKAAAIDLSAQTLTSFSTDFGSTNPGDTLRSLAFSGNTLYAGGNYAYSGALSVSGLACIDIKSDSIVDSWTPIVQSANAKPYISDMIVYADSLYFCGKFNSVNGLTAVNLAGVSTSTGNLLPYPNILFNDTVKTLCAVNNKIVCGGLFTTANGIAAKKIIAVNILTNTIKTSNLVFSSPSAVVTSLLVKNNRIFAGGEFTLNTPLPQRKNLVAIDTGTLNFTTGWQFGGEAYFRKINRLFNIDNELHVAGISSYYQSYPVSCHSVYSFVSGAIQPFNPGIGAFDLPAVYDVAKNGDNIFITGRIDYINTHRRYGAVALDLTNDKILNWAPQLDDSVYSVAVHNDKIYVGGTFSERIVATDRETGAKLSWNPKISDGSVNAIAVGGNNVVYVGGSFTYVNNANIPYLAAIDASTALVPSTWKTSNIGPSNKVNCLKIYDDTLYFAGFFNSVSSRPMPCFAYVSLADHKLYPSSGLQISSGSHVNDIYKKGNVVYLAGVFRFSPDDYGLSVICSRDTLLYHDWEPPLTGYQTFTMIPNGNSIFLGGEFSKIGSTTAYNLALVDDSTGAELKWTAPVNRILPNFNPRDIAYTGQRYGNHLIVGGGFETFITRRTGVLHRYKLIPGYQAKLANSKKTFCQKSDIAVKVYTIGNLNDTNNFILQLSDTAGSFASPLTLTTLITNQSSTINVVIPSNLPAGKYKVRVISNSTPLIYYDTIEITVKNSIPLSTINGPSISVRGNREVYSVTNTPGSTYHWTVEKGFLVSGQNTSSINVNWIQYKNGYEGKVKVREINSDGCVSDQAIEPVQVDVWPSSVGVAGNKSIAVYPNPFAGSFEVLLAEDMETADLHVYSITGQLVLAQNGFTGGTIDLSSFPAGVYILELNSNGTTITQKIVKAEE